MSAVWISVIVVGLATMAIKAAGAAALLLRAPLLVVITAAAVTAALVRVVS